jgi:P4 family phage/plasmid primase-like protien
VHTPDLFSTFAIGYNYDPAADCPCFIKYLNEVQPEADSRECLQMLAGLALIPDTRYEVIFILYGEGGTGKSVFLHILEKLVDSSNVCCLPLAKFAEKHSAHLLTEHLLNIVGDLPTAAEGSSLHHIEGYLKDVASGGLLPVERKNKDPYKAPAIARCIFASNSLPTFADRSNGIWDRLRIVSFNQRFRDTEKQNSNLKYEIAAQELPGILNWAIAGLAKLRKQARFPNTTAGKAIRDKHRNDCDHERQFLDEYYTEMNGCYVVKSDMYKEYREWSSSAGFRYKNSSNFYNDVLRALPKAFETRERIAGHNSRIFKNIARVGQI